MQPPMKTSKTLFFLLGALLAALLTWWLACLLYTSDAADD